MSRCLRPIVQLLPNRLRVLSQNWDIVAQRKIAPIGPICPAMRFRESTNKSSAWKNNASIQLCCSFQFWLWSRCLIFLGQRRRTVKICQLHRKVFLPCSRLLIFCCSPGLVFEPANTKFHCQCREAFHFLRFGLNFIEI